MAEGKERKGPNFTAATYINSALKKAREVGFAELSIDELVTLADNLEEFTHNSTSIMILN